MRKQLAVRGAEIHRGQLAGLHPRDLLAFLRDGRRAWGEAAFHQDQADGLLGIPVDDRNEEAGGFDRDRQFLAAFAGEGFGVSSLGK